jgi:hypothetical protein
MIYLSTSNYRGWAIEGLEVHVNSQECENITGKIASSSRSLNRLYTFFIFCVRPMMLLVQSVTKSPGIPFLLLILLG